MTRAARMRTSMFGVILALGACNSGDDAGPPVPVQDLARELANAVCNNIGPCCQEAGYPFEVGECRSTAEASLTTSINRVSTSNVNYDAKAARGCVDYYARAAQACTETGQVDTSCATVFTGTLPEGAVCTQSSECVSGSCRRVADGSASHCGPGITGTGSRVHGKAGEACGWTCTTSGSATSCSGSSSGNETACYTDEGLYCNSMRVCATVPSEGQSCAAGGVCAGEAFCENGVCTPKRTSGSCASNFSACASSAYCNTLTFECLPRKATGEACTNIQNECQTTDRCTDGTCRRRTVASANLCRGSF